MDLVLLKTEIGKVWDRPIFELAVGFVFLLSLNSISTLIEMVSQARFQSTFNTMIIEALLTNMNLQLLPLGLLCGILVSLSFARDYEQGLMQTLMSLPLSRSSIFVVKFIAVVIPLTAIYWGITTLVIILNFHSSVATIIMILELTIWTLPISFLALMFYGGTATLFSLTIRRMIPTVLTTMITGFFTWYITALTNDTIGDLADLLVFTPYRVPNVSLGRVLGLSYPETALENCLPAWGFLGLALFYALVFLIPMYLYFTRRFEVRD